MLILMQLFRFSRPTQAWGVLAATCMTLGAIPLLGVAYALSQGESMGDVRSLGVGAALLMSGAVVYAIRLLAAYARRNRAVNEDQSLWEGLDDTERRAGANGAPAMNEKSREDNGRKNRAA